MMMIPLTEAVLNDGRSTKGGWSKDQLACLGVSWPPATGWKAAILGQPFPEEALEKFKRLKRRPYDSR